VRGAVGRNQELAINNMHCYLDSEDARDKLGWKGGFGFWPLALGSGCAGRCPSVQRLKGHHIIIGCRHATSRNHVIIAAPRCSSQAVGRMRND
jgi:hypothetical protein